MKRDYATENYYTMKNYDTDFKVTHGDADEFHVFQWSQKE